MNTRLASSDPENPPMKWPVQMDTSTTMATPTTFLMIIRYHKQEGVCSLLKYKGAALRGLLVSLKFTSLPMSVVLLFSFVSNKVAHWVIGSLRIS